MKKLLFGLLLLITSNVFGQDYTNFTIVTESRATNTLVWNQYNENWDFVDNNDVKEVYVMWKFVIDKTTKIGTIIGGNVSFNATLVTSKTSEAGNPVLMFQLTQIPSGKKLDLLVTKSSEGLMIGLYDYTARTSYYYY